MQRGGLSIGPEGTLMVGLKSPSQNRGSWREKSLVSAAALRCTVESGTHSADSADREQLNDEHIAGPPLVARVGWQSVSVAVICPITTPTDFWVLPRVERRLWSITSPSPSSPRSAGGG